MRTAPYALAVLLAPAIAAAGPGELPILGGTQTTVGQYPTVVAVEISPGALCTGTLIHPEWVLTAAHCVHPQVVGVGTQAQVTAATSVRIDSVTAFTSTGRSIAAMETIPNPGFSLSQLGDDDIGLIRLSEPVDDRMVSRVNRAASSAPVGVTVDFVGYGRTSGGTFGRQFELLGRTSVSCAVVDESDANLLCFDQTDGKGQCQGDSGGPTFVMADGAQTVVGVTSFGDQNCQFFGAETRVDAEVGFLDEHIGASLKCVHDGFCAAGCFGLNRDQDCPLCADDDECEGDFVCDSGGSCVPAPFSEGGLGFPCIDDSECLTGACLTSGDQALCSADCTIDGDDCPDGFECLPTDTDLGACWPCENCGGGGGCATTGESEAPTGLVIVFAAFGLVFVRRRQRLPRSR